MNGQKEKSNVERSTNRAGGDRIDDGLSIRVYVADPHALVRFAIRRSLGESADFEIVGETDDGRAAAQDLRRLKPDVAIVAERLPSLPGLELLQSLSDDCPTRIVLSCGELGTPGVYAALVAGAAGYLSNETTDERLRDIVAAVARGEAMLAPDIQAVLMTQIQRRSDGESPALTPREREALALIAEGYGAAQIAAHLHVGVSTAKKHLQHVYDKLEAPNSAAAVARAMRLGLLD
jgi:two-component system nitrate/nitrite response regulator NarL